jgi:hypothetical protein
MLSVSTRTRIFPSPVSGWDSKTWMTRRPSSSRLRSLASTGLAIPACTGTLTVSIRYFTLSSVSDGLTGHPEARPSGSMLRPLNRSPAATPSVHHGADRLNGWWTGIMSVRGGPIDPVLAENLIRSIGSGYPDPSETRGAGYASRAVQGHAQRAARPSDRDARHTVALAPAPGTGQVAPAQATAPPADSRRTRRADRPPGQGEHPVRRSQDPGRAAPTRPPRGRLDHPKDPALPPHPAVNDE